LGVSAREGALTLVLVLTVGALASGCGWLGGLSGTRQLTLGYIAWDENVAVSNLTMVLLEDELGYEVELSVTNESVVNQVFQGVASGELDAFQDVWLPNHEKFLSEVEGDVEYLEPWYEGEGDQGLAVPHYMDVRSVADLDRAGTDMILGVEPGAAVHPQIKNEVIPGYDLEMILVESSTPAMLSELEKAYEHREPIVVYAWSPHWMNARYDLRYLEDPRDLQGVFNDQARISSIVNADLPEDDPVALALLEALSLDEDQLYQLEAEINAAGSSNPEKGVRNWVEDHRDIVRPWVAAAREAQEE
jgi:glycine betaine/proline transport system substrate-binding protein